MSRTVLSSWRSTPDGKLEDSDYKICIHDEDGTYEIETTRSSMGLVLGPDPRGTIYAVIVRIVETDKSMEKIKTHVTVGDILVAINDRVVLDESFADITSIVDLLTMGGFPRRYKFLNRRKCSIEAYLRKVEMNGKLRTDMLGFSSSVEEILSEQAHRQQTQNVTMQRDMEWVDYLKSIGGAENLKPAGIYKPSQDLKLIVRRGIPVAFRALIWPRISLSALHRLNYPKDHYAQLLRRVDAGELNARVQDDIEKDVDRTFPEHAYFENSGMGEAVLRRVLRAFAMHNPDIGYCQSLNFVAGMILILMEEEEAFWLLVTIVDKLLPPDYYTKSMVGTYVDQFVLAHIIKKYLPRIHSALEKNQLQLPLITVQWFMCLFVNTLRPEVTLRVWDIFLNEGNKVLFRISAALFKLHEKKLLGVKDASDLFTVLRSIGKDVVDPDLLIATAYKDFSTRPLAKVVRARSFLSPSPAGSASRPTSFGFGGGSQKKNQLAHVKNGSYSPNGTPISSPVPATKTKKSFFSSSTSASPAPPSPATTPPPTSSLTKRRSSLAATIHSSFQTIISPRLSSHSLLGAVPQDLIGVGFAHTGPADALAKYHASLQRERQRSSSSSSGLSTSPRSHKKNHNHRDVEGTLSDEEVVAQAMRVSRELLAAEQLQGTEEVGDVDGLVEGVVEDVDVDDDDHNDGSVLSSVEAGDGATTETKPRAKTVVEEVVVNPELLLNRVSEIRTGSFSETKRALDREQEQQRHFFHHGKKVKKSELRDRRSTRNGEFAFYRADIALWRSSFRPGLEERYQMMEAARTQWREENSAPASGASTPKTPVAAVANRKSVKLSVPSATEENHESTTTPSGSASQTAEKSVVAGDGEEIVTLAEVDAEETKLQALRNSLSTSTRSQPSNGSEKLSGRLSLNGTNNTNHSPLQQQSRPSINGLGMMQRLSLSSTSLGPSNGSYVPSEEEAAVAIVLETTYSIDHTFDLPGPAILPAASALAASSVDLSNNIHDN